MRRLGGALPCLFLVTLGLVLFRSVILHPGFVLYSDHSDFLAQHLPFKRFLVESWRREGELPLWCPASFGGTPLLHDVQVAAFYPPHLPLYFLPPRFTGWILSLLVPTHVIGAGLAAYAYGRSEGLGAFGALVTATSFMLAGKWLLHLLLAGQMVMAPLAWLPLACLLLSHALRWGRVSSGAAAGLVLSVMLLGSQPQIVFYSGIFLALGLLGDVLYGRSGDVTAGRALGRAVLYGTLAAITALSIAAVQVIPAIEAARESSRQSLSEPRIFEEVGATTIGLFGPPLFGAHWESQGGLSVIGVALALVGTLLGGPRERWKGAIVLGLVAFSLGGERLFLHRLPLFHTFQNPSRMLMVAALPLALLAGRGAEALLASARGRLRLRAALVIAGAYAFMLLTTGLPALVAWSHGWLPSTPTSYAATLALGLLGWGLLAGLRDPRRQRLLLMAMVTMDLLAISAGQIAVRPEAEIYAVPSCVRALCDRVDSHDPWRVLERPAGTISNAPLGFAMPLLLGIEPVLGYKAFDVARQRAYLGLVAGTPPLAGRLISPFQIRNRALLDLMGVRFLLQPKSMPPDPAWRPILLDEAPPSYSFLGGGLLVLPPYALFENETAFPRAFVVPEARPAFASLEAEMLHLDPRDVALVEGLDRTTRVAGSTFRPVAVRSYLPNRVILDAGGGPGGTLILADTWFPGWTCRIDGTAVPVLRADFLFRSVLLPEGAREIVWSFEPWSYRWGCRVSIAGIAILLLGSMGPLLPAARR